MKIISCKRLKGNRLRLHYADHVGRKWSDVKGLRTMRDLVRLYLLTDPVSLAEGETVTLDAAGRVRIDGRHKVPVTGRPPLGMEAMTGAERVRRYRERKRKEAKNAQIRK